MSVERNGRNTRDGRYRDTEYCQDLVTIAVIQDVEDDRACIQSTVNIPPEL